MVQTRKPKKENLIQRLNRSMAAIEINQGDIVKVKNNTTHFNKIVIDDFGSYTISISLKKDYHLMYLGIEKIGPFIWAGQAKRPLQSILSASNKEVFAFKFLYEEQYIYLIIPSVNQYYTIFSSILGRLGGVTNFGK
jgi:hypothetical protein